MIPSTLLLTFLRPKTNALRWTWKHPKVTHFFLSSFIHGFLVWISPKKVRTWSLLKTSKIANPPQFCYWRVFYCIKHRPLTTKQLFIWSGQYVLGSSWHHIYYSTSFVRRPSPNPTLRSTACATPSFRPATRSEPKFENYCVRCHPLRTTATACAMAWPPLPATWCRLRHNFWTAAQFLQGIRQYSYLSISPRQYHFVLISIR